MNEQDIFEVRQTDVEIQEIFDQVPKNTKAIEDINGKLPAEASPENPLTDKEYVDGKVAEEKNRAEGAESSLQTAINSEAQARHQADQTLDGKIGANTQAIANEKTRAEGAEQVLDDKITAEKTRAEGAEGSLQTAIGTEAQTRQQADGVLDGKIVAEKTRAEGAEQTLQTAIDIINGKIPAQATAQNQLADKNFVNSSISTALGQYYTKTEIDTALATINTAIGQKASQADLTAEKTRAQQAEQDNAQGIADNAEEIAKLKAIVADIETIAEGYVRVAGSSSPALSYKSYKYHEQGGFGRESVFSLFYPCLVGTPLTGSGTEGKVLHVLQKFGARTIDDSPKWLDIYNTPHAIDGSEGDVMIVNIEPFYSINGKHTIEGTEYDVFLMSRTPFTWQGIEAEHMEKFGWAPDYTVAHQDTDNVTRMHSVYNPAWNGSYDAPVGVAGKYIYTTDPETGDIVETYDANETLLGGAGGLHSTDINLPNGEQYAMNNNDDPTKTVPWMNQTAEGCNRLMSLILAEGGTFDAHNANLMGSGFCSNDPATAAGDWEQAGSGAKNGMRVMDKNGEWKYYSLGGKVSFLNGATTGTVRACTVINAYRNPWHIMEAHRAVSYAIENDVHELEWFVFEGNKYKYRSVQGFNGPSHGEMTCVVWKLMATQAGANAIDPTDKATSIAGNRVEILVSTALVHGMTTQVSPSWWTSGLLFTEDENGQYECYMERDQAELVKSIAADNYDPATPRDFETIYDHVLTVQSGDGYAKNYLNGALMLPDSNANKTGAGLHTYVGKYNWFTGDNASAGKKSVRGFLRGNYAYYTSLSPLTLSGGYSPSSTASRLGFGTCCRIAE
ncbi:MAG: hypothetical protein IKA00_08400 [Prevotella sp.]|nr:hypothetical protein [Prevotella sp.]